MSSSQRLFPFAWILLALGISTSPLAATPQQQGARSCETESASSHSSPGGEVFLTMDEALKLAFPDAKVARTTAYLDKAQQKAIQKACGNKFSSRVVYPYVAKKDGKVVGTAYFDTHRVRSLRQTLMIVVDANGKIARVELLAFAEPKRYMPKPKWLRQFVGAALDRNLKVGGRVRAMSGATLTAKASVDCSRRVLALHQALQKPQQPAPKPDPKGKKEKPSSETKGKGGSKDSGTSKEKKKLVKEKPKSKSES